MPKWPFFEVNILVSTVQKCPKLGSMRYQVDWKIQGLNCTGNASPWRNDSDVKKTLYFTRWNCIWGTFFKKVVKMLLTTGSWRFWAIFGSENASKSGLTCALKSQILVLISSSTMGQMSPWCCVSWEVEFSKREKDADTRADSNFREPPKCSYQSGSTFRCWRHVLAHPLRRPAIKFSKNRSYHGCLAYMRCSRLSAERGDWWFDEFMTSWCSSRLSLNSVSQAGWLVTWRVSDQVILSPAVTQQYQPSRLIGDPTEREREEEEGESLAIIIRRRRTKNKTKDIQ